MYRASTHLKVDSEPKRKEKKKKKRKDASVGKLSEQQVMGGRRAVRLSAWHRSCSALQPHKVPGSTLIRIKHPDLHRLLVANIRLIRKLVHGDVIGNPYSWALHSRMRHIFCIRLGNILPNGNGRFESVYLRARHEPESDIVNFCVLYRGGFRGRDALDRILQLLFMERELLLLLYLGLYLRLQMWWRVVLGYRCWSLVGRRVRVMKFLFYLDLRRDGARGVVCWGVLRGNRRRSGRNIGLVRAILVFC